MIVRRARLPAEARRAVLTRGSVVAVSFALISLLSFGAGPVRGAGPPTVPTDLVGNYGGALPHADACLSVTSRVVTYASLSHDSERGCGVDMPVVSVTPSVIVLRDGDREVRLNVLADELRFDTQALPVCAHHGPRELRFARGSRRGVGDCFE